MSNHANPVHMDESPSSVAARRVKEGRVREAVIRGNAIARNALREVLWALKGGIVRKPRPEEIAQKLGDTLRDQSHPFAPMFEIIATMKEDGLSHQAARVFASKISVGFVDSIYSDEAVPALEVLAPALATEQGEATAAQMRALHTRCPSDHARAADEIGDVISLAERARQRCLLDSDSLHRPLSAATR